MNAGEETQAPSLQALAAKLGVIETKVDLLASLLAKGEHSHTATVGRLLVGWPEISAYVRKSPRTLRRYARNMVFPSIRFGRHVVSSPYLIDNWLQAINLTRRRQERGLSVSHENPQGF